MTTTIAITTGSGRANPQGEYTKILVNGAGPVRALANALEQLPPTRDGWWSGHLWDRNYRGQDLWRASQVAMVDGDYHNDAEKAARKAAGEAKVKITPPEAARTRLLASVRALAIPGTLFHETPHGFRLVFFLREVIEQPARMNGIVHGAAALVHQALERSGLAKKNGVGYAVDEPASTDLARFMFGPRAIVDGKPRKAEVLILRDEPYDPTELVAEALEAEVPVDPAPSRPIPPRGAPQLTVDDAARQWNADHPGDWPRGTTGNCPVCGGKGGFGRLPERREKWFCWHQTHSGVGRKTERGHFGDALDLEAHARGRSRVEVLKADGYLIPAAQARPRPAPTSTPQQRIEVVEPLPEIQITTRESEVVDQTLAALSASERAPFRRGGLMVHVVHDTAPTSVVMRPADAPRISPLASARLRELCSSSADFQKFDGRTGSWRPAHVPEWLVNEILARESWPMLRPLEGVTECPVLRPDGTILSDPGYDDATGILYQPATTFPAVPASPSRAEAIVALDRLANVVVDFPFKAPTHRAAWFASVLTPLARHAFRGPSPLNLIDANTRGAGKSLLADVTSEIVSGRPMARMAPVDDDDEWNKRILALAIAGDSLILIDNIAGTLGAPALDAALTGTTFSGRVLGQTRTVTAPLCATWYATGNNVVLAGDLARRCSHIRLESPEELPERRTRFAHPDLLPWVRERRAELVAAGLTVLRGYSAAGRPDMLLPPWGSFEGWSKLVRGALVWAGEADPGETRAELQTASDRDAVTLGYLIAGWEEVQKDFTANRCTVSQVLSHMALPVNAARFEKLRAALAELVPSDPGKPISPHRIGKMLQKFKGRVVGGASLQQAADRTMAGVLWQVQRGSNP
jgi:hypothetical protein